MAREKSSMYHSRFGGLWTDLKSAGDELAIRRRTFPLTSEEHELLTQWIYSGFVILEGAVPEELCSSLSKELADLFQQGDPKVLYQAPDSPPGDAAPVTPGLPPQRTKVVDHYAVSEVAARVLSAEPILGFLRLIFEEDPLCFQSLSFEKGSEQGLHQDTAYVVVDEPLQLAASWVALEDIEFGSGELMFLEGSHRLPDWCFGETSKNWNRDLHGDEEHEAWSRWLVRRSEEFGFEKQTFRARRGDVLIYSADLVQGEGPIENHDLTRRSIVGHYCPVKRSPSYFTFVPNRVKVPFGGAFFSSSYYELDPNRRAI